jgi:serine/threonine-protein kinase
VDAPTVPGFTLDRLVGEGGFGQVWRATNATGEVVAIKVLHLELVRSIDALTRFQRELEAIERLHHRSVVRALSHGSLEDGRPFLVLEYLEGPSLREVLHENGALPPPEMLTILAPLCDALSIAHAAGLVHRDVKASNVILAHDAGGRRPVLLDFGLVKLIDQVGPGLTSSRSMLGTPAAMAPEQMRGQPVDARTDVYALGLLAFHMLTGQPAFGGAPGVVQSYMQIHGARPRPSTKVEIDPAIDAPIGRALAPEQRERFATPKEFYDALHAVIHPTTGAEQDVIAVYAEGPAAVIAQVTELVRGLGMTIGLTAPDSVLAVMTIGEIDVGGLRGLLAPLAASSKIAVGKSRALIQGGVVDGEALDAEAWAPYPLPDGLWVADDL